MKLYTAMSRALLDHGVDTIFGLMGDVNMLYLSSFLDAGGQLVRVAHEGSSVGMADAWSRLTGRIGVASVTHGPALTNTMTSLVEASRAGSRVLVLTGQTPLDPTHFQRIDIAAIAAAAEVGYEKVHRPESLGRDLDRALQRIEAEQRPVILDLPIHLLRHEIEPVTVHPPVAPTPRTPDLDDLDDVIGLLAAAHHPIVLAGRGALRSGAREALIALADALAAPLATTALAKDLFTGHPSNIGICGNLSHGVASTALAQADVIIAFGGSLNTYTAHGGEVFAGKKVIQVDTNPGAFNWFTPVDHGVCGDAAIVAELLTDALDEAGHRPARGWLDGLQRQLVEHRHDLDYRDRSGADTLDPRTASIRLNDLLPPDRVLVSDIGRYVVGAWPYLQVPAGGRFTSMGAFGAIGLGLAGAIGASVAHPEALTILAIGDGGLAMSLAELPTAIRDRRRLLVLLYNDGAYGAEYYKLVHFGEDADHSLNSWPEIVPAVEAMGGSGLVARTLADLDAVPALLEAADGPVVVDIRMDPRVNILAE
ncbi:thiamine pyrophosphate-binding protein [Kribbia dieselivorans]|uniref:thiamine pyrophosphate-binding protein n=1 Tax=Kribbia dieselivorans TaxID=331526 RepID=UPI00083877CE|nr:thiamine pyrophosphate-binding protein [Kribbia dieselivorans]